MDELLTLVLVIYIIVGALVYFATDTTTLASRIEAATPVPWGVIESSVFAFVVALWPAWLLLGNMAKRSKRP
jgi:hypothetical protein